MIEPLKEFIERKLKHNSRVSKHTRDLIVDIIQLAYEMGKDGTEITLADLEGVKDEEGLIAEFLKNNKVTVVDKYFEDDSSQTDCMRRDI